MESRREHNVNFCGTRGRYVTCRPETGKTSNKKICGTCLRYRGNSQAESEGDRDVTAGAGQRSDAAAANQDKEERAQEFSGQHAPYVAVVRDVVQPDHSPRTCVTTHYSKRLFKILAVY